jgi:hypothetical protein
MGWLMVVGVGAILAIVLGTAVSKELGVLIAVLELIWTIAIVALLAHVYIKTELEDDDDGLIH